MVPIRSHVPVAIGQDSMRRATTWILAVRDTTGHVSFAASGRMWRTLRMRLFAMSAYTRMVLGPQTGANLGKVGFVRTVESDTSQTTRLRGPENQQHSWRNAPEAGSQTDYIEYWSGRINPVPQFGIP